MIIFITLFFPFYFIALFYLGFYYQNRKSKYFYKNGRVLNYHNKSLDLHRVDKPAVIEGFSEKYYENNLLHNLNGPAIISHHLSSDFTLTDDTSYYIEGEFLGYNLSKKEFERLKSIYYKKKVFS